MANLKETMRIVYIPLVPNENLTSKWFRRYVIDIGVQ